jgi:hypothetical protein
MCANGGGDPRCGIADARSVQALTRPGRAFVGTVLLDRLENATRLRAGLKSRELGETAANSTRFRVDRWRTNRLFASDLPKIKPIPSLFATVRSFQTRFYRNGSNGFPVFALRSIIQWTIFGGGWMH